MRGERERFLISRKTLFATVELSSRRYLRHHRVVDFEAIGVVMHSPCFLLLRMSTRLGEEFIPPSHDADDNDRDETVSKRNYNDE